MLGKAKLSVFITISILIIVGLSFWIFSSKGYSVSQEGIKVKSERERARGSITFGYGASEMGDGSWSEAPDGIKKLRMNTKLIRDFTSGNSQDYFLAYQYEVQLIPQEKKKSDNETYADLKGAPIAAYCIEFNFYLLDEDGYCLMEIRTDKAEKRTSPNHEHFIMVKKGANGYGQVIITDIPISQNIVERTKKIVYWPEFRIGMWDYRLLKEQKRHTDGTVSNE